MQVLRLPTLRRLIGAFLAFSIGEWASWIAVVVFAYSRGGATEAGVVACVIFVPSILVAPLASFFGDRRPRAQVLTAAYGIQAASMALTAFAIAIGPPIVAYAFATLTATSITLARPAHAALLPEVVQTPEELAVANAASGTVEGLGALLGPLLAGALVGLAGPAAVYGAIAILSLGSALVLLPLARSAAPVPARPIDAAPLVFRDELIAGLRTVGGNRRLLAVFAILSGSIALLGALNVLYTVIAVDLLGADENAIGYLAAVGGLGSVLGAGATGALMGRERLAAAYVAAAVVFSASVALIGLDLGAAAIIVGVVGAGLGWAFVYVEAITLAQRIAGDNVMSRVLGVMEALMMASQSLGALAVPFVIAIVGPTSAIVACGVFLGAVSLLAGPTLIRADRLDPRRTQLLRVMRNVPMFGPLAATVLERLVTGAVVVSVPANAAIIREGEMGDRFYLILGGSVRVTSAGRPLRTQGPGEAFGEIALLRDIPRTATVTAIEPVELLAIERGAFLEALTGQPRSRALADDVARGHVPQEPTAGSAPQSPLGAT